MKIRSVLLGTTLLAAMFAAPVSAQQQLPPGFLLAGGTPGGGVLPPADISLPTISGTAQVGSLLTASIGSWSGAGNSYTYQWNANGTPIGGATGSTYTPVSGDIGSTITVTVTATNSAGSASATSLPTSAVIAGGGAYVLPSLAGLSGLLRTLGDSRFQNSQVGQLPVNVAESWGEQNGNGYAQMMAYAVPAMPHSSASAGGVGATTSINGLLRMTSTRIDGGNATSTSSSISGTTLTIGGAVTQGTTGFLPGAVLTGPNVTAGTVITAFGTGTSGAGTYTVSPSQVAATAAINELANPATTYTGDSLDALYSIRATGGTRATPQSIVTAPGSFGAVMDGINDSGFTGGSTTDTSKGCGPTHCYTTDPIYTFQVMGHLLDTWAPTDRVYLSDETPHGYSLAQMEPHAVAGAFTVTNTSGFVAGLDFVYPAPPLIDQTNTPWTRVANAGACAVVPATYYVAAGVYTPCSGITPWTTAYVTYAYGPTTSTELPGAYHYIVHQVYASNAATTTASGVSTYTGPGLLYNRPNVGKWATWEAMLNPADTTNYNAYPGLIADGTHPAIMGAVFGAAAFRAAVSADYPAMSDVPAGNPTGNVWNPCEGYNTGQAHFGNTQTCKSPQPGEFTWTPPVLPTGMQGTVCTAAAAAGKMAIMVNSVIMGTASGGTFSGAGISSGTYNCSTGAWDVTFSTAPSLRTNIEITEDSDNVLSNPMMDFLPYATAPSTPGTQYGTQATNITGNVPTYYTVSASGNLATDLASAAVTIAESTVSITTAGGSQSCQAFAIAGIVPAGHSDSFTLTQTLINPATRIPLPATMRLYETVAFAPGANGQTYGVQAGSQTQLYRFNANGTNYPGALPATTSLSASSGAGAQNNNAIDSSGVSAWIAKLPSNLTAGGTALVMTQMTEPIDLTGVTFSGANSSYSNGIQMLAGPVSATAYLCPVKMWNAGL